jgi:hypothetical protein
MTHKLTVSIPLNDLSSALIHEQLDFYGAFFRQQCRATRHQLESVVSDLAVALMAHLKPIGKLWQINFSC